MSGYEPSKMEIVLHKLICHSILSPVYASCVRSMGIQGAEQILEFGSGSGAMSKHLVKRLNRGGVLICVDISKKWLDVVRRRLRRYTQVEYYLGKIWDVRLSEDRFDLAIVHYVLHDIPSSERVPSMMGIRKLMKPGATLFVREPDDNHHGMPLEEIEMILRKVGFKLSLSLSRKTLFGGRFSQIVAKR